MTKKKQEYTVENCHGEPIAADPNGNNVAFICQNCGHPILAQVAKNESGHFQSYPVKQVNCKNCNADYSVRRDVEKWVITITYKGLA